MCVMRKLLVIMLIAALGVDTSAQEMSPYSEYKIRQGVTIEVQDVQRVIKLFI